MTRAVPRHGRPVASGLLALGLLLTPGSTATTAGQATPTSPATPPAPDVRWLLGEVDRLTAETDQLRRRLAEARLAVTDADREIAELRQFIEDHHELGDDFVRYRAVMEVAERDARRRQMEAGRERRDAEQAERRARRLEIDAERAAEAQLDRYRDAGFSSLGLDVWVGRMAYSYLTRETNPVRIDYDPFVGLYYRPGGPTQRIDYSRMTISGSVLNATDEVRNVGIAITFFDAAGNQVGSEIARINNARPDVPYPFTSTIEMALDRPFASSSTYVLYADPVAID